MRKPSSLTLANCSAILLVSFAAGWSLQGKLLSSPRQNLAKSAEMS